MLIELCLHIVTMEMHIYSAKFFLFLSSYVQIKYCQNQQTMSHDPYAQCLKSMAMAKKSL